MKGYVVVELFRGSCACGLVGGGFGARLVVVDLAIGLWLKLNSCEEVQWYCTGSSV